MLQSETHDPNDDRGILVPPGLLASLPRESTVLDRVTGVEVTRIGDDSWVVSDPSGHPALVRGDVLATIDLEAGGDSLLAVTRVGGAS